MRSRWVRALIWALLLGAFAGCGRSPGGADRAKREPAAEPRSSDASVSQAARDDLTADEMSMRAPADAFEGTPYAEPEPAPAEDDVLVLPPVPAADAGTVVVRVMSERGYENAQGQHVVDLLERELAYLVVKFETTQGNPVSGARARFAVTGGSRVTEVSSAGLEAPSDDSGMIEFGVQAGAMGADELVVSFGAASKTVVLNVISLQAAGYAGLDEVEGALSWDELMRARVRYTEQAVVAEFPAAVSQHHRQTVKLVGFMMPLEPEDRQRRFLLTSNPPNCFFHVPGGPAGAVEVFADPGVEPSWDPLVLEGRFETVPSSDSGVIYRLHDARVVKD